MVWGWATCAIFLTFIALAIAELGSACPTAGGLYFWTFKYSSPRYRRIMAWVGGYMNSIGYIAGVAGVDWVLSVQIMAGASIGSDFAWVPTNAQTFGVFCGLLILHVLISSLATKFIARLHNLYIAANVLLCLIVLVALPAATPPDFKNSAKFAFGGWQNMSGWSDGFTFILSFLAPLWSIGGFDSSVHISEEARNATVAVPWAVIGATCIGSILGWAINVSLAFNMGTDLESIVTDPIGQPMAVIFYNGFGKRGTLAAYSLIIVTLFLIGNSVLTATSRLLWAFSRDGAAPFAGTLYRINRFTGTPVNAVCFAAFCACLLGLLSFAGAAAVGAVFSLGVIGQYLAMSTTILTRLLGSKKFVPGAFSLGMLSVPVAVTAVVWMLFMVIVLLFPANPAPSAASMNYSTVVVFGTLILAIVYYFLPVVGGVRWFEGPIATVPEHSGEVVTAVIETSTEKGFKE